MEMKALSIRQPWAWLIIHGHKPVENRSWATKFRGAFLIHASKGMTNYEYDMARDLALTLGVKIPYRLDLDYGGIVGQAEIVDCVQEHQSPWFFGEYGFVLASARFKPFIECKGALGFFTPKLPVDSCKISAI